MASYFLDTSAIVKRYFPEQGHTWILALCLPAHGNRLYISQAALVEVVATICRKAREQLVTVTERDLLIEIFRQDSQNNYTIISMIGEEIALPTVTPEPCLHLSMHTAPQCMVSCD